jgi:DNA modification methylase
MKWGITTGDALDVLAAMEPRSVQTCVTSPPYWGLRDYGVDGQIGLESTPEAFVARMVEVFREVRRVLRDDGTLWLNLGDSYASVGSGGDTKSGFNDRYFGTNNGAGKQGAPEGLTGRRELRSGLKPKDLCGIPWRVAFALQADGWFLRSDIIWHKPNPMPESVRDRPTKSHEYIFLMSKSARYLYDADAISEPHGSNWLAKRKPYEIKGNNDRNDGGQPPQSARERRNRRSVWTVTTRPYKGAHFATFPPKLIEPCILAGAPRGAVVLDPFAGAGTTGLVSVRLGRSFRGVELNPVYADMARKRIIDDAPLFNRRTMGIA